MYTTIEKFGVSLFLEINIIIQFIKQHNCFQHW